MVIDQEPLIKAIKDYLIGRLNFDKYSLFKLEGSQLISINYAKSGSANSKPQVFFFLVLIIFEFYTIIYYHI
jgi:hypothetical protein